MDGQLKMTDCDEAGDDVVPNVLSPRDLVFRPDNMDETVPHTGGRSCIVEGWLHSYSDILSHRGLSCR